MDEDRIIECFEVIKDIISEFERNKLTVEQAGYEVVDEALMIKSYMDDEESFQEYANALRYK